VSEWNMTIKTQQENKQLLKSIEGKTVQRVEWLENDDLEITFKRLVFRFEDGTSLMIKSELVTVETGIGEYSQSVLIVD